MKKVFFITSIFFALILLPFSTRAEPDGEAMPVKILLVPGHDNEIWGAQYGKIKEADMNLRLAQELFKILRNENRFETYITRDNLGYTTVFADYFASAMDEVIAFKNKAKKETAEKIDSGELVPKEGAPHNNAAAEMALKLYAFNKWAGENNIDAVVHIHFNDYPRPSKWLIGKYRGFVIYVPEAQMQNAKASITLGESIFVELKKKYITSTYPWEKGGLVPDQELIALGGNGTLPASVRSVLIEYGYIYRFGNTAFRHGAYKDMAARTATGIKNYFFLKW